MFAAICVGELKFMGDLEWKEIGWWKIGDGMGRRIHFTNVDFSPTLKYSFAICRQLKGGSNCKNKIVIFFLVNAREWVPISWLTPNATIKYFFKIYYWIVPTSKSAKINKLNDNNLTITAFSSFSFSCQSTQRWHHRRVTGQWGHFEVFTVQTLICGWPPPKNNF
jgi:hypothetical protein